MFVVVFLELPRCDCFADSTPLGFNTTWIPHFKTPKKIQTRSCRHKAFGCWPLGFTIEKDLQANVVLNKQIIHHRVAPSFCPLLAIVFFKVSFSCRLITSRCIKINPGLTKKAKKVGKAGVMCQVTVNR